MHGGTNLGAPKGNRNAWKHGDRSAEAEAQLKTIRGLNRTLRAVSSLGDRKSLTEAEITFLFDLMVDEDSDEPQSVGGDDVQL